MRIFCTKFWHIFMRKSIFIPCQKSREYSCNPTSGIAPFGSRNNFCGWSINQIFRTSTVRRTRRNRAEQIGSQIQRSCFLRIQFLIFATRCGLNLNVFFWEKLGFLTKILIFDQKLRFRTKKWCLTGNSMLLKKSLFGENSIFDKKLDLWQKIRFLIKFWMFDLTYCCTWPVYVVNF